MCSLVYVDKAAGKLVFRDNGLYKITNPGEKISPHSPTVLLNVKRMNINVCELDITNVHHSIWSVYVSHWGASN